MNIGEMHFAVKMGLNKRDSSYRNLQLPELDWFLNQAQQVFVKACMPQSASLFLGREFEISQRSIDSIRVLVTPIDIAINNNIALIPNNYLYYVSSYVDARREACKRTIRCYEVQHDDLHRESANTSSSFDWNECNISFEDKGIIFHTTDFTVSNLKLVYIREPKLIHNAAQYIGGTYNYFGTALTGTSNCELPVITHDDIVRIAIFLASRALEQPASNQKYEETKL